MQQAGDLFSDEKYTTAIYPNRIEDKQRVESECRLDEFGDDTTQFVIPGGGVFAVGYQRVVYGDHGPYVEFDNKHVRCRLARRFDGEPPENAFYEWLEPAGCRAIKVYLQRRTVAHLRNPPAGGFKGNRKEGYADYKVGMLYVDPFAFDWTTSK